MSKPYNVIPVEGEGCEHCGAGMSYDIVGPNDVALSRRWVDYEEHGRGREEAEMTARELNDAFALGNSSSKVCAWIAFADQSPNSMQRIIVWDNSIGSIAEMLFMPSVDTTASLEERQFTHWMPRIESPFPPPAVPDPVSEEVDDVPF